MMADSPVVTRAQMRAAEEGAFARGISAEQLMEEAGEGIAQAVDRFFPRPGKCIVFAGKGNNAGDAFVAAAHLARRGWEIEMRLTYPKAELGELAAQKLVACKTEPARRAPGARLILLDGLLGLGGKPPLREPIRIACREMNRLRLERSAFTFAIDLPTGLDGNTGKADADCVVADFTVTIGLAKVGLVADAAVRVVGRLEIVPLPDLLPPTSHDLGTIATPASLGRLLPRRAFDAYKNQFGRIGIVAGAKGLAGAATLCSLGALRGGGGLVELFVPEEIYPPVAAMSAAEVMVKPVQSYADLLAEPVDVWGIGPGLGKSRSAEILELLTEATQPMVVDADALNVLSQNIDSLGHCRGPRLLTPHPGEMKRLFPSQKATRRETVEAFCAEHAVTLLLKGSRTVVGESGRACSFNTTGNPAMATGGMGDVLTGVCAALIGQKLSLYDAARLGAWACGRAAEIALFSGLASQESLLPTDVLEHLGAAFNDLRR